MVGPVGRIPGPTRGARAWSVVLLLSRGEVGPAAWWVPVGPTQRHIWPASSRLARLRGHGRRGAVARRARTERTATHGAQGFVSFLLPFVQYKSRVVFRKDLVGSF